MNDWLADWRTDKWKHTTIVNAHEFDLGGVAARVADEINSSTALVMTSVELADAS